MFKSGEPRPETAGRKAGTPNKKTQALLDKCIEKGIDPFEALLEFCKHADPNLRFSAIKEACSYLYPKRKPVDGPIDAPQSPTDSPMIQEFKTAVVSLLDERKSS